jgi:DNA-binding transcriptional LysR family regulator
MNQEPDWLLYRTCLAVLQEGSLSGAARRLGVAQPTVARHVEALESAVRGDLFVRSQRGLIPTDLARNMLPYAESLAATAAALQTGSERRRRRGGRHGTRERKRSDLCGVDAEDPR